jgi:hypothetical protein
MDLIYSASWATIIAMSGTSANTGLPRVMPSKRSTPPKQLECALGSITLRSAMPNLQTQAISSPWAKRAWTYQESICSNRSLWFTPDQVYFECHTVTCCEALDESESIYHNLSLKEHEAISSGTVCNGLIDDALGQRFMRTPLPAMDKRLFAKHYFASYCDLVEVYSKRRMTFPSDGLNACNGVLRHLTRKLLANKEYSQLENEYFWGLPQRNFTSSLLWSHVGTENADRRVGFPSWSWVGWQGEVLYASARRSYNSSDRYHNRYDSLRAWRWQDGKFEKVSDEHCPTSTLSPYISTPSEMPFSEQHMMQTLFLKSRVLRLHDTQWRLHYCDGADYILHLTIHGSEFVVGCFNKPTADLLLKTSKSLESYGLVEVHEIFSERLFSWVLDFLLVEWIREVDSVYINTTKDMSMSGKLARRVGTVRLRLENQESSTWKRWLELSQQYMRTEFVLL